MFPFNLTLWTEFLEPSKLHADELIEIFQNVKNRIYDPSNWWQGADGADRLGRSVEALNARACRWCARGAVQVETDGLEPSLVILSLKLLNAATAKSRDSYETLVDFNDTSDHQEVLALLDWIIEQLRRS